LIRQEGEALKFLYAALVTLALTGAPVLGGAQDAMTDGEVTKLNKPEGKITIKHGPIDNLGMPAMTMVFRVADPAMLDEVAPGDKVRFVVEKIGGLLTLTEVQKQP
jgi:Cu(I)/Ag(I) efflux system protein CusF